MTKTPTREIPYGAGSVVQRGERWQARWFDETGTRRSRMFDSADEANDYLRDRFRARRDGRSLTPSNLTVADLIGDWLDRGRDDWRPTSWAGNRHVAETRVIPAIGHIRADMLDPPQVQRWIDGMRRDKRSAHWIDRCLRVISGAYRQAIQIGIVRTNPVDGTKRPTVRKPDIVTWAAADVAVIDAALADEPLWQAVYRMALTTGMRPGELRALRWSDIDMTANTIHIRRTMTRDAEDRPIVGNQTKTGRDRTVTLAASAKAALERWQPEQEKLQSAARRWDQAGYVFTTMYGGPLSATTWQQRHKRLVEQTGVPYITLHGLRHSFATIAMERNIHMRIVAEILGHSSVQITLDRYSHPSSAMQQQASKTLDSALFGQVGTTPGTKA